MSKTAAVSLAFFTLALGGCDQLAQKGETAASCGSPQGTVPARDADAPPQKPSMAGAGQMTQQGVSTIVEQLTFQLCTARTNHWIDDEYYRQEMTALRRASFDALGVKTAVPAPAVTGNAQDNTAATNQSATEF